MKIKMLKKIIIKKRKHRKHNFRILFFKNKAKQKIKNLINNNNLKLNYKTNQSKVKLRIKHKIQKLPK